MDMTAINPGVITEYRRSGGVLSGDLGALPVLLLTTVGRRSGRPHTTPLGYVTDGDRFVVAASAGGAPSDPDWYRNLVASPSVTVEVGADTWEAHAAVAAGHDRDRLFDRLAATLPGMAGYAATVDRPIPVVVLTPAATPAGRAARLRSLHRRGDPLLLVNAWDVASARRVVAAGGRVVATSSAAMAASLGLPDDPSTPRGPLFDAIGRIARAVDVPVSADLLDGYGLDPDELVDRLLAAGAVGCNLEDSDHAKPGELLAPDVVADRIAAVRATRARTGVDVVVNARVDSYLRHGPAATADVLRRARHYLDAGADCVYPVGLTDPGTVARLVEHLDAGVNANLAPPVRVGDLAAAGASRVSIGPGAFHAALATVDRIAADILTGPAM